MDVKQFHTGGDRNFGYLAADTKSKEALIVDPSYSPEHIVRYAEEKNFTITYIFITHGHYDHTQGNAAIERLTQKKPLLFKDIDPITGTRVDDGATFPLGDMRVTIIHTPGHTNDSICIYIDDALFTGDTLFVGKVGGTDYSHGARKEYDSLHNKLFILPDKTRIFPGHDYGIMPESTIAHERMTNPFLLQPDFEAFVHLKRNWAAYKKEHGIS
ncbi:MAG: hydroxyacylglutathione hydrolase family protein [bacterium]